MNIQDVFNHSYFYSDYRNEVDKLIENGKTTGNTQNEKLFEFTKLNVHRMNRLDKTIKVPEQVSLKLNANTKSYKWLLIGDAWCGDCAQIVPVINKVTEASNNKIAFKIVSRDAFPEFTHTFQTNGSNSIPKLLILDNDTLELINTWGPRPKPAQAIMLNWKANSDTISWEDFEKDLHLWYSKDKGVTIIEELITLV